jgi:hypothetical protein
MSATDDFYRTQAQACAVAAEQAQLDNQREKYLSAQRAWEALADRTAKIQSDRDARVAEKAEPVA